MMNGSLFRYGKVRSFEYGDTSQQLPACLPGLFDGRRNDTKRRCRAQPFSVWQTRLVGICTKASGLRLVRICHPVLVSRGFSIRMGEGRFIGLNVELVKSLMRRAYPRSGIRAAVHSTLTSSCGLYRMSCVATAQCQL